MTWTREEHISDVYTCIGRGVGPGSAFRGLSRPSPLGSRFQCHRLGEEGGGAGSRLGLPGVSLGRLHMLPLKHQKPSKESFILFLTMVVVKYFIL